ncbi:hypothetical protein CALVIDRAFT_377258 [Calocera viscosa TUFC12733]|uniref:Uncharacterized protein n=1 Tax=Calocera viscosa (strain TUFC12733) TaxID=1330018 RepID=A0A167Q0W2_CALVF|nr:hypothetical protein CALVIDRAFT_377258 [Calocera viscosa TUFC12733]
MYSHQSAVAVQQVVFNCGGENRGARPTGSPCPLPYAKSHRQICVVRLPVADRFSTCNQTSDSPAGVGFRHRLHGSPEGRMVVRLCPPLPPAAPTRLSACVASRLQPRALMRDTAPRRDKLNSRITAFFHHRVVPGNDFYNSAPCSGLAPHSHTGRKSYRPEDRMHSCLSPDFRHASPYHLMLHAAETGPTIVCIKYSAVRAPPRAACSSNIFLSRQGNNHVHGPPLPNSLIVVRPCLFLRNSTENPPKTDQSRNLSSGRPPSGPL